MTFFGQKNAISTAKIKKYSLSSLLLIFEGQMQDIFVFFRRGRPEAVTELSRFTDGKRSGLVQGKDFLAEYQFGLVRCSQRITE